MSAQPLIQTRSMPVGLGADDLIDKMNLLHETVGGVYAGALNIKEFLRSCRITSWFLPPDRRELNTAVFVREHASTI